eukprot:8358357-Pyramimonas_sp.AAC.1
MSSGGQGKFTFVHSNCMSASEKLRLCDLSEEFTHVDIIALSGTGEQRGELERAANQLSYHFALHHGYALSRHAAKACGLTLLLQIRKFRKKHVVDSTPAPRELRWRVALHRVRSGRFDLPMPLTCFPPEPSQRKEGRESLNSPFRSHRRAVDNMSGWLETVFTGSKARSSLGPQRQPGGRLTTAESQMLGPYGRAEQRYAGAQVLEVSERHGVAIVSTDFVAGNAYYGNGSSTPIDYVAAFHWQRDLAMSCHGLRQADLRLKLVAR